MEITQTAPDKLDITLSQKFDAVYSIARKLLHESDDEPAGGAGDAKEKKINECIQNLEELTCTVSRLSLFSNNETFEELSGDTLKFMLLPYLLGSLWQIKNVPRKSDISKTNQHELDPKSFRKNVDNISQIYFQDFIQRCLDYNVIRDEPSALRLYREFHEVQAREDEPGLGDANFEKKQINLVSKYFDSSDRREQKVRTYKESKELEKQIKAMEDRQNAGEELDDETVKSLYLAVLRKAIHDANSQIESIIQELHLLNLTEGDGRNMSGKSNTAPQNPYGLPFKTFILTKTDLQKNVFGMGYPSLPVMTVEELYEQRREDGTWPGPPTSTGPNIQRVESAYNQAGGGPEEEEVDEDDPEYIARQRNMDEYKDTHRRGWGNRMNRS